MKTYHRVMTIAGSDSGGGAGIQADIKTFSALGCFGTSAITAITAQNTLGVRSIHAIPTQIVHDQITTVLEDIGTDAIKIGMLHSVEIIELIAQIIQEYELKNVVLDPVMVATSGDKLIQDEAIQAIREKLIPLTTIVTPNLPEATELTDNHQVIKNSSLEEMAQTIHNLGAKYVLIKGGHLENDTQSTDIFYDGKSHHYLYSPRIQTKNTHGTGCTLSSAVASFLAHGQTPEQATKNAKDYISHAILHGKDYQIGQGHGAVHHFYKFWKDEKNEI